MQNVCFRWVRKVLVPNGAVLDPPSVEIESAIARMDGVKVESARLQERQGEVNQKKVVLKAVPKF